MSSSLPSTEERLANYYAAEARCLEALRTKRGDRERLNADLAEVRRGIEQLRAQLYTEQARTAGQPTQQTLVADFSQPLENRTYGR